jgi:hypothetical protein
MKQAASSIIWELGKEGLLKQKTQDFVPLKTFPVPELIQTLPSPQPQGSSRRSISEKIKI